jgi:hypothetical protein
MRKRLVSIALAAIISLAASSAALAQTTFGVKGGANIAEVSTNVPDLEDLTSSKTGFVGGAFATFGLGTIFALQPEVLYSQKGFKAADDVFDIDAQLKTNYFEIPLLLKAQLALVLVRPAIYAGPVVSFETSCKVAGSEGGIDISVDCDDDLDGFESRKKTDWGAVFGANIDFMLGPIVLILDGRYQLGLTNLNDDPAAPEEEVKTRMWQFMAGVGFQI